MKIVKGIGINKTTMIAEENTKKIFDNLSKYFMDILKIFTKNRPLEKEEYEKLITVLYKKYETKLDKDSFCLIIIYVTKKKQELPKQNYLKKVIEDFIERGLNTKEGILEYLENLNKQIEKEKEVLPSWFSEYAKKYEE